MTLVSKSFPVALYRAADVRELDRRAIEGEDIAGIELMTRAGEAAFGALRVLWPRIRRIVVVCGFGNNGGDGYVLARLAKKAGLEAVVFETGVKGGDAATARDEARRAGVDPRPLDQLATEGADVVVDALLGTGLARTVKSPLREAIDKINRVRCPVLAIDVPSGLNADTGAVMGAAVRASATVSFIGLKLGLFTGAARDHCGEIFFDDLAVPAAVYKGVTPAAERLLEAHLARSLAPRRRTAHKGSHGRVLVVGGNRGMPGAPRLAARAALRAGAGLAVITCHPSNAQPIAECPESLIYGVRKPSDLKPMLASADCVALGPGLGRDRWAKAMLNTALGAKRPLVVDADGLNLLPARRRADWVLTPHPGEAARLLKTTVEAIERDRPAAAAAIAERYGGVCVLKGAGTLIADAQSTTLHLCDRGNPGLATAGTGDVLTGVIAALWAQGLSALDAARIGVFAHAAASDDAAGANGELGLIASDLPDLIRARLNRMIGHDRA